MICGKEQPTHAAFEISLLGGTFKRALALAIVGQLVRDLGWSAL
jgi:hypothetical protein